MGTEGLRKCCHCGIWFRPHGRNAWHQRFCLKPECQVASKRASQRKWCRKNPGYFHGEMHVKRVQRTGGGSIRGTGRRRGRRRRAGRRMRYKISWRRKALAMRMLRSSGIAFPRRFPDRYKMS